MTDNERRLRNSLKNALQRIDTLTRLLEERSQSSTNALIKTYRLEPMTPAEPHDARLAFAAKCDEEDDEREREAIQDQIDFEAEANEDIPSHMRRDLVALGHTEYAGGGEE